ncbi:hemolysin-III related-domain-containing protein [Kockovaella imperatae]|uniref:Hemolysin-III related-domain-containing protein n=1 Tax=Kockovaella imperatae TaxID=4999 RepID=A0A1Y1UB90_9TREE|nr:hemolysin-III related-domain-containing protein [Kockovaella imperatae]ORX35308.1 hemolysin-III related-domain-containing protein [Kockovaella imperatae]
MGQNHQPSERTPLRADTTVDTATPSDKDLWRQTLTYEESHRLLPWQSDNDHIRTGYRRQIRSIRGCIWSAFAFFHNETVNIHTHSIGAFFFAILIPLHLFPTHFPTFGRASDPLPTPPTTHDKIALTLNLVCSVACLGLSSWFHTVCCHSREVSDLSHRGDYVSCPGSVSKTDAGQLGIVILTCGTIIAGLYYSFYGQPVLQGLYMGFIFLAGVATTYTVLSPAQRTHRWRRTTAFIALGLSAVIPVAHVIIARGLTYARQVVSLDLVIAGGASYIFGAILYAARVPERFSPGTFDYLGASHQIFHCFVLGGAGLQYAALRGMVWGRQSLP